ncbi:hypothetical protein ACWCPI_05265 [Streptomyces sp. NPDC001920]
MSNHSSRPNSVVPLAALLAVLVGAEVAVIAGDLGDGVRYPLGGVILAGLILGAYRLGHARTSR